MKLKDIISKSINSNNKQVNWNLRKKKLKALNLTESEILNMKIDKVILK